MQMKAEPRCIVCTLKRGLREIEETEAPLDVKRRVMVKVLEKVREGFERELTPAEIGVSRYETIKRYLDIEGRYSRLKEASQEMAIKTLEEVKEKIKNLEGDEKFHQAFLLAVAANAFDFDLLDHSFTIPGFKRSIQEFSLAIDERAEILDVVKGKPRILYLLDNAGEVVFDMEFIEILKDIGARVTLGVKGYRFQNDVTREDLERWGYLERIQGLLTMNPPSSLEDTLEKLTRYDLIISKGMFNFEILEGRIEKNIVFALTAKCLPIANTLGVERGKGVILLKGRT